jgi:hypothetical protein
MRNERDVFFVFLNADRNQREFCSSMFFGRTNVKAAKSNPFQAICNEILYFHGSELIDIVR